MKDYYLLVGLNSKEVKITKVNQNEKGILDRNLGSNVAWISEEDYNAAGGNWSSD